MSTALPAEVEEKLKVYRAIQTGAHNQNERILVSSSSALQSFDFSDIQTIYGRKQQTLSQFNENTLVKGVRLLHPKDSYLDFEKHKVMQVIESISSSSYEI